MQYIHGYRDSLKDTSGDIMIHLLLPSIHIPSLQGELEDGSEVAIKVWILRRLDKNVGLIEWKACHCKNKLIHDSRILITVVVSCCFMLFVYDTLALN